MTPLAQFHPDHTPSRLATPRHTNIRPNPDSTQTANKGKFASLIETLPSSTTGKDIARWGPSQYNHFCGGAAVGSQLQKFVRNETVRADKAAKVAKEARANA